MTSLFRKTTLLIFIYSTICLVLPQSDLSIPEDAIGRPNALPLRETHVEIAEEDRNKCYCTYGNDICGSNFTCIKDDLAACFHAIEEVYNKEKGSIETWHKYGCAPLEKGSNASHLTCNSWRSSHAVPKSIGCCYEGNYCNKHIIPPPYVNAKDNDQEWFPSENNLLKVKSPITVFFIIISVIISIVVLCFAVLFGDKIVEFWSKKDHPNKDLKDIESQPLYEDSGSGSGQTTLNQRTVANDLRIIKVIGRGRYGEVRKATYRGSYVAVKTFCTTDEESWKNERDVYQTHMFNHENILQYVAADICSENSITQMLIITDYHELGSLSDYLRREETLTIEEGLQLALSTICGIDHLHNAVHGTGNMNKPEIAHRDIKSKNIIVKRKGVCCIADFGLAVRFEDRLIPEKVNIQVGTKRYMSPEVLSKTLMANSFVQFKMADIYSFSLVLWEIARRIEWQLLEDQTDVEPFPINQPPDNIASDSSGYVGSSDESQPMRIHMAKSSLDMTSKALPYVPPYEGMVENDPSFEEMRVIVCDEGKRPPLDSNWNKNKTMVTLSVLMKECWHSTATRRHSALKIKMELTKALGEVLDAHSRTQKHSLATCGSKQNTDSGFQETPKMLFN